MEGYHFAHRKKLHFCRCFGLAEGDETFPGSDVTAPYFLTVRDALDHWRRGAPPPISVHDCARAVRLIDQAYERAGVLS